MEKVAKKLHWVEPQILEIKILMTKISTAKLEFFSTDSYAHATDTSLMSLGELKHLDYTNALLS
ncbi:hypothetical protein [Desulforamulus aquiferis]|uniref:Uncharacterized protein n=1 Tax=Desulforamulus aquiferis TaxID=1397668 RepID=A0AAW7ZG98_9FIRM|nr:hypothetical protein [Desulforamulus aquiferis]MDO7788446.1 hypothetical protein [Desulforamulus aquiferis]RYD05677.1 hypothetical protein N752_07210 [Desulforamulus aquiferis]